MAVHPVKEVRLRGGQVGELIRVAAPDPEWVTRLCAFLNRPPTPLGPSLYHFLLTRDLPGLHVSFYTMVLAGEIVGCVVTSDSSFVGYINSTFVSRERRRLGIARALMEALEQDFDRRDGRVRFFTTRTESPAEELFRSFGYSTVWQRSGRSGMERHSGGSSWVSYFSGEPSDARVVDVVWAHWVTHRALMWTRPPGPYHPLIGDFESRMRECHEGRCHWNALILPDGRLVGEAVLRRHDEMGTGGAKAHVLEIYVHPRFRSERGRLFDSTMPTVGRVETFLDGSSAEETAWFENQGFRLESRLRDDYNHHDPSTPDVRVYGISL